MTDNNIFSMGDINLKLGAIESSIQCALKGFKCEIPLHPGRDKLDIFIALLQHILILSGIF